MSSTALSVHRLLAMAFLHGVPDQVWGRPCMVAPCGAHEVPLLSIAGGLEMGIASARNAARSGMKLSCCGFKMV